MYNPQLETFVRVADAGSFNKAADDAFITPTAVIKQINLLESELDLKLFVRSHRGWSRYMDELRDDLAQNHPDVQITDFDFYDVNIFNRCEQSRNVLTVIGKWSCVHPPLKVLPVAWDHSIPFGILHPPEPSPMLARFLDAVRAVVRENG